MKKPWNDSEGPAPEQPGRGSYPPDVARLRRRYGLPVTPEEHAAYRDALLGRPARPQAADDPRLRWWDK